MRLVVPIAMAAAFAASCGPGEVSVDPPESTGPTWHDDVAPLFAEHCQGCHQPGQVAGTLPLTTAAEAAPWSARIAQVVADGSMPPWGQQTTEDCPTPWSFLDDPRPTAEQRGLMIRWAQAGAQAGDPQPAPEPRSFEPLADANQRLAPAVPFEVPSDVEDVTICFPLDPELVDLGWLEGVQVEPDHDAIVHHAGIRLDLLGTSVELAGEAGSFDCTNGAQFATEYLGTFAPGSGPSLTPPGTAMPIPPGAVLVLSVHYHPVDDEPVLDQTGIALRWADGDPDQVALLSHWPDPPVVYLSEILESESTDATEEAELVIPAGATHHVETLRVPVPGDPQTPLEVWQIAAHMHEVGAEARIVAEHPDGTETCLLHVPRWDFDWQRIYRYDLAGEHPTIHPGDVLRLECTYDNSLGNAQLAESLADRGLDAPVEVVHGSGTYDEMCMFLLGVLLPDELPTGG